MSHLVHQKVSFFWLSSHFHSGLHSPGLFICRYISWCVTEFWTLCILVRSVDWHISGELPLSSCLLSTDFTIPHWLLIFHVLLDLGISLCVHVCTTVQVWRSGQFLGVDSFLVLICPGDGTWQQAPWPTEPSFWFWFPFSQSNFVLCVLTVCGG